MCLSIRRSSGLPSSWRGQPAAHQWYVHTAARHCDRHRPLFVPVSVFYQYSIFSDYSLPGVTPAVSSHFPNENLTVFPLDSSNNLLSAPLLAVAYNSGILKPATAKWRRRLVEKPPLDSAQEDQPELSVCGMRQLCCCGGTSRRCLCLKSAPYSLRSAPYRGYAILQWRLNPESTSVFDVL